MALDSEPKLTPAQARILARVREKGEASFNGLARRPIEKLVALGLIEVIKYDLILCVKGSGSQGVWSIRVRPKPT